MFLLDILLRNTKSRSSRKIITTVGRLQVYWTRATVTCLLGSSIPTCSVDTRNSGATADLGEDWPQSHSRMASAHPKHRGDQSQARPIWPIFVHVTKTGVSYTQPQTSFACREVHSCPEKPKIFRSVSACVLNTKHIYRIWNLKAGSHFMRENPNLLEYSPLKEKLGSICLPEMFRLCSRKTIYDR